uniref:Aminotransferase class I/classII domain-containing protein n=1 Tax=Panagrolaimus superbus TaxID=310955 RepID=A0A914Y0U6_9BILA
MPLPYRNPLFLYYYNSTQKFFQGFIKLSSADNILSRDLISQKFSPEIYSKFDVTELTFYPQQGGEPSTREAVASFINTFCAPNLKLPINKDQLALVPGVTYTSDLLSQAIFDEGDSLITFAPLYYRFPNDFGDRGLINVESIDGYNSKTNTVELNVEKFEQKFQQLEAEGKPVKAILLVNPRNPDGGVFGLDELKPIVEWAVKK